MSKESPPKGLGFDLTLKGFDTVFQIPLKVPAARAALALPTGRTTGVRQNLRGMRSLLRFNR
jgi:hypothetical protein